MGYAGSHQGDKTVSLPEVTETALRGRRRTFAPPGLRRTCASNVAAQGLPKGHPRDGCFHRELMWRRYRHCDERSEPGTRGDSPWLFRNPLLNHKVVDKSS